MQTIEYKTHDKTDWPEGEWKNEYDKKQWRDEETGLPCLVVRGPQNALCGYVGVTKEHPFFAKHYDEIETLAGDLEVHGGITFTNSCMDLTVPVESLHKDFQKPAREQGMESIAICHKVETGEDDNVWWLGFDCAHYMDAFPGSISFMEKFPTLHNMQEGTYRNTEFVENEVRRLAKQVKAAA